MDITVIWFPLLKGVLTSALLYGMYFFVKRKHTILAVWYGIFLIMLWVFTPIKYDGTNSVARSVETQHMQKSRYSDIVFDAVKVESKRLTFDERMEAEALRSVKANEKVKAIYEK